MPVFFALGFRPFFLLAGLSAIFLVAVWVPAVSGWFVLDNYYGQIVWHSHEMIFGYTTAVIAGFLLTAVRNWTEKPTPAGGALAALSALWLLGRILPYFPEDFSPWLIAAVDLAFVPAVAVAIGVPLVRSGEPRNLIFPPLLLVFWAGNVLVHAELLGFVSTLGRNGVFLGLNLSILLIVIVGGRVIPFFTERALPGILLRRWKVIERLSPLCVTVFLLVELWAPDSRLSAACAALAACANGVRLAGWYSPRYWRVPLLWVLHLGYGWIVLGFFLKAGAGLGAVPPQFAVHAFTVGGIGVLTLGMMARVALGHTGRPLKPAPAMVAAFVLLNISGVLRGLLPIASPQWFSQLIAAGGVLWVLAFIIFVVVYAPVLAQPRIDGHPG